MSTSHFIRVIRRKEVLALAFGAMIGWSWVALSAGWIETAGSVGAMLAFAGGGIAVILVGVTYAELASAMPLAGGEHVYSYRALGAQCLVRLYVGHSAGVYVGRNLRSRGVAHCR